MTETEFEQLLRSAKMDSGEAVERLYSMFLPLIRKKSREYGIIDEDLFQKQCLTFLKCVRGFKIEK